MRSCFKYFCVLALLIIPFSGFLVYSQEEGSKRPNKVITFDQANKIDTQDYYEYNDKGEISLVKRYKGSSTLVFIQEWLYDEKGRLSQLITYSKNKEVEKINQYFYDEKGEFTFILVSDKNKQMIAKLVYEYDSEKRPIALKKNVNNVMKEKYTMEYDKGAEAIQLCWYTCPDPKLPCTMFYFLDFEYNETKIYSEIKTYTALDEGLIAHTVTKFESGKMTKQAKKLFNLIIDME